jgi:hypothetical protein
MSKDQFKSFGMEPCVVLIDKLVPYSRNSRTHTPLQISEIAASIKEFGWRQPIVIDADNVIRAGHGRFLAAQNLGLVEVPCLRGNLTETQWKAYVIADNRIAEKAGWDAEMLKLEIEDLKEEDFDIALTGFNQDQLNTLFDVEFQPDLPPEQKPLANDQKYLVTVTLQNEEEQQELFDELNERGFKVKV